MTGFHDELKRMLPRLRVIARGMTRNACAADDLVQEAVAKALAGQHGFAPGTNFGGWIYRILRNEFISSIRRQRPTVDIADVAESLLSRPPSQEDRLVVNRLGRELQALPAAQREALLLVAIEGVGYEEISARLGVPVGTAKSWVFRARRTLQARLLDDGSRTVATARPVARATRPAAVAVPADA